MKTGCYTDLANDRTFANELCCSLCECHIRTSPCDIVSNHVSPALATTRRGAGDIDIASSLDGVLQAGRLDLCGSLLIVLSKLRNAFRSPAKKYGKTAKRFTIGLLTGQSSRKKKEGKAFLLSAVTQELSL